MITIKGMPFWLYCKALIISSPMEGGFRSILSLIKYYQWHRELREIALEEQRIELILAKHLKPNSNCVDVGCHIGSFLSSIIVRCPEGEHFAFEPSKAKSAWLTRKFPSVRVYSMAAGATPAIVHFEENRKRPGFSRIVTKAISVEYANYYDVKVARIDDVIPVDQRIHLLKLDIEGYELHALKGAKGTIQRNRPIILFECGPDESLKNAEVSRLDLFEFLTQTLQYDVYAPVDALYNKGPITFDEFRKCGLFPFRAFNFFAFERPKTLVSGDPRFELRATT